MTEECLTFEASQTCPCEFCKRQREITDILIEQQVKIEALRMWISDLEKSTKKGGKK